jgi:perosamine synthetase
MSSKSAPGILAEHITAAIRGVVARPEARLHEPTFAGNEWTYLKECLDSTFVSSVGKFVDRFEADLATYTGAKHAIAVMNGTAALHIALRLAGVTQNDEVLIPALTFVATANAVTYCGAISHFIDSEERTLGVDPKALRDYLKSATEIRSGVCVNKATGRVIRALVPMHTFGHPVDLEGVLAVARDFHLVVIEDAAESLGSTYLGRHTGTFGLMGILSFNGNKILTSGGGGAVLTNDSALAKRLKHVTTTAKIPHAWEFNHDEVGFNYRMPNLNAALAVAQLEQLPSFVQKKRALAQRYQQAFAGVEGVKFFSEPAGAQSNYWLNVVLLNPSLANQRDEVLKATNAAGLMTRPAWTLLNQLSFLQHCPKMPLTVAESLSSRLINIPSSVFL